MFICQQTSIRTLRTLRMAGYRKANAHQGWPHEAVSCVKVYKITDYLIKHIICNVKYMRHNCRCALEIHIWYALKVVVKKHFENCLIWKIQFVQRQIYERCPDCSGARTCVTGNPSRFTHTMSQKYATKRMPISLLNIDSTFKVLLRAYKVECTKTQNEFGTGSLHKTRLEHQSHKSPFRWLTAQIHTIQGRHGQTFI